MHLNYPPDVTFHCKKCGLCCGNTQNKTRHVLLLESDATNIATQTNRKITEFTTHTPQKTPYIYEMKKNPKTGKCIFNKNHKCTIYELRPLICRFYPFELTTKQEGIFTIRSTNECPGISHLERDKTNRLDESYFIELVKLAHEKLNKPTE
jgi:Fe-S-cluster containining protein